MPESALGDTPLSTVVDRLTKEGYVGQFQALAGGRMRCLTCHNEFDAAAVRADDVTRLEGASDPDDMAIVVPIVCPICGTPGTFVALYGPGISEEDAEVLQAFERTPEEGDGGRPTPGIV
jgi:hypothetical protein